MSHHGRLCVEHLRHGEDAIERLGGLWPTEEHRIRHGDHTAITRRLEPAFTEGQRIVIAHSYSRAVAVRDRRTRDLTGEVIPAVKTPSLVIEMAKPRRHRKGHWLAPFAVVIDDRRRGLYLMPTAHAVRVDDKGRVLPMSQAEEHGMTTSPRDPVGAGGVLSGAEYQTVIQMPSRLRKAEGPTSHHERRSQERAVREELHQALEGLSPIAQTALLAGIKRQIEEAIEADAEAA